MKSDLIDIEVQVHHRTELAVLVSTDGNREKAVWLPLSQIEIDPVGKFCEVTLPEAFAAAKGLV
jgi:hypothetical protein